MTHFDETQTDKNGGRYKSNGGVCYDKRWYHRDDKEQAEKFAAEVWESGITANGGWFDGMRLGVLSDNGEDHEFRWEVTC